MHLRPSTKFIKLGYVCCVMIALAIAVYLETIRKEPVWWWAMVVPGILLVIVMVRHVERRLMKLEIFGDRLRFQSGFLSKTTRTMELAKVQDVRVDQTLGQRMIGVGDLSFETAGETSRIIMRSIDRPQLAADHILELARSQRIAPGSPGHAASQTTP